MNNPELIRLRNEISTLIFEGKMASDSRINVYNEAAKRQFEFAQKLHGMHFIEGIVVVELISAGNCAIQGKNYRLLTDIINYFFKNDLKINSAQLIEFIELQKIDFEKWREPDGENHNEN